MRYRVTYTFEYVTDEIEAESEQEAYELADEELRSENINLSPVSTQIEEC